MTKCVNYLRTSTTIQDAGLQAEETKKLANQKGYEIVAVFEEKLSAFKQVERPYYEKVKEMARKREIDAVIVWALDRWVRNRDTLLDDVVLLRNYGVKIHSVKEAWLEAINIEGAIGKTVTDFLLGLIGSIAEMESQRKSERVKMAYQQGKNKRKWGRPSLSKIAKEKIISLHQEGKKIREIADIVSYADRNNNMKNVSIAVVHKIIKDYEQSKPIV